MGRHSQPNKRVRGTTGALRLVGAVFAFLLMASACGEGGQQAADGGDEGEQVTSETATQAVRDAWEQDAAALGVEPPPFPETSVAAIDTSQYAKEPPYRIAFASQGPTNVWATMYEEVQRYWIENEYGDVVEEFLYAGADGNVDKQVNDINDLLVQQPDALIVTPMGDAVAAPLQQAASANIPVIFCTGVAEGFDQYVTNVERDNRLDGAILAEWIAKEIDYEGNVVMLSGIPGVPAAEDRITSAMPIWEKYPDIEIIAHEYTDWSATEGKRIMETLLAAHPQIDGIWSDSANQLPGVVEAYVEAGREDEIPPMTGDNLNGLLRLGEEYGFPYAVISYPPDHSSQCIDAAIGTLRGETQPQYIPPNPAPVFTNEEADQYFKPECTDDLYVPTVLPDDRLQALGVC